MTVDVNMSRTVYYRSTGTNGATTYHEAQCWEPDLFIETRQAEADEANKKDGSKLAGVQQITREVFQANRKPKGK